MNEILKSFCNSV